MEIINEVIEDDNFQIWKLNHHIYIIMYDGEFHKYNTYKYDVENFLLRRYRLIKEKITRENFDAVYDAILKIGQSNPVHKFKNLNQMGLGYGVHKVGNEILINPYKPRKT